jgi:hypothetical protein
MQINCDTVSKVRIIGRRIPDVFSSRTAEYYISYDGVDFDVRILNAEAADIPRTRTPATIS